MSGLLELAGVVDYGKAKGSYVVMAGGIQAAADTKPKAARLAIERALSAVSKLDRDVPEMVVWRDRVCMVFPRSDCAGSVAWCYTYPRTLAELSAAQVGWQGMFSTKESAVSMALFHMAQNAADGVIPPGMNDERTRELRDWFQVAGISERTDD